ncbi:MAG: Wsp signal transduction system protein-glutamate methylesterase WspF [Chamaesiphon sp.]
MELPIKKRPNGFTMRIAIVNDQQMSVKMLEHILATVPDYELAWVACDGAEAVAKCAADTPDLILMGLHMPVMDGVEATRRIMTNHPCAILVVTSSVKGNASEVFEAMGYGALDAVNTPVIDTYGHADGGADVLAKIATIGKLIGKPTGHKDRGKSGLEGFSVPNQIPHLVVIGASTGGPKALAEILSQLPESFHAAVVIVQHVDAQFASGMVEWLNNQTLLSVELAVEGEHLQAGKVLMAGTNEHLVCRANLTLSYTAEPRDSPYRPSVDTFFKSLAKHWPEKGTAVLLTGMGRDGAEGLSQLRSAGWHTIAQDSETSVVYGMPKAAAELGAAVEILSIQAIAPTLVKLVVRL